jgi:hypothetical protein
MQQMSNLEQPNTTANLNKLLLAAATVLGLLMFFSAGLNAKDGDAFQVVYNVILGLLFLGTVAIVLMGHNQELRNKLTAKERDDEMRLRMTEADKIHNGISAKVDEALSAQKAPEVPKELSEILDKVLGGVQQHHEDMHALGQTAKELGLADENAKLEDMQRVADKFMEKTGRFIHLTWYTATQQFDVEFGDKPFAEVVTVDDSKGESAAGATPVAAPAKRKPTAAQQRKANAAKGRGAITDAEYKIQKAEERKQKRAEAKAQKETSTTTTTVVE